MSFEMIMIGIASLVAIGILLHHPSKTVGIPSLLIFMSVGFVFGNGEFDFVYDNLQLTSFIGGMALNVIVFVGGLNTSTDNIKLAWKEGGRNLIRIVCIECFDNISKNCKARLHDNSTLETRTLMTKQRWILFESATRIPGFLS